MNQILLTENENSKKKNNKNQYGSNNSPDMKRIMIFFGIAVLIFALLIIGVYAYKTSKNNSKKEEVSSIEIPQLSLEESENMVKIIAKSNIGINKVIYSWNGEEEKIIEGNGVTDFEETLKIPEGTNKLNVLVIDQNNQKQETEKEFFIEEDKEKPKIDIDGSIGNGKVKITATDENNGIKFLRYRWNDEEEVELAATEEGQTAIETTIDVKRGENTLNIVAINKKDKEETLEKKFKGVNKPKIEVVRDGDKLVMKMTHDMGFKKIEFKVNGQEYIYDENYADYDPQKKEVEFSSKLVEGENNVEIHAISNEKIDGLDEQQETEETYIGRCNYTAE